MFVVRNTNNQDASTQTKLQREPTVESTGVIQLHRNCVFRGDSLLFFHNKSFTMRNTNDDQDAFCPQNNLYVQTLVKAFHEFLCDDALDNSNSELKLSSKIKAVRLLFPEEKKRFALAILEEKKAVMAYESGMNDAMTMAAHYINRSNPEGRLS